MGLLELEVVAPAARWASVVAAAPDLQHLSAPSAFRAPYPSWLIGRWPLTCCNGMAFRDCWPANTPLMRTPRSGSLPYRTVLTTSLSTTVASHSLLAYNGVSPNRSSIGACMSSSILMLARMLTC